MLIYYTAKLDDMIYYSVGRIVLYNVKLKLEYSM
jgi:hypothetical protein